MISEFLEKHGYILTATVLWPIITGFLNYLLHQKSPEEWVSWSERNPRLAVINKILRASGFDPVKFLEALKQFIEIYNKTSEPKKIEDLKIPNLTHTDNLGDTQQEKEASDIHTSFTVDLPEVKPNKPITKKSKAIKSVKKKKSSSKVKNKA